MTDVYDYQLNTLFLLTGVSVYVSKNVCVCVDYRFALKFRIVNKQNGIFDKSILGAKVNTSVLAYTPWSSLTSNHAHITRVIVHTFTRIQLYLH